MILTNVNAILGGGDNYASARSEIYEVQDALVAVLDPTLAVRSRAGKAGYCRRDRAGLGRGVRSVEAPATGRPYAVGLGIRVRVCVCRLTRFKRTGDPRT